MSIAGQVRVENYTLGSGELYIDRHDADGNLTGEEYLGISEQIEITVNANRTVITGGDGPVAETLVDELRDVTYTGTMTLQDQALENFALFLLGDTAGDAIAATATTLAVASPVAGRWYQMPKATSGDTNRVFALQATTLRAETSAATPTTAATTAVVAVTTPEVTDGFGDKAANPSFIIDPSRARVYSRDGSAFKVTGTPVADTAHMLASIPETVEEPVVAIRFVSTRPTKNERRFMYAPRCRISPTGSLALKSRDALRSIPVGFSILEPTTAGLSRLMFSGTPPSAT